MQAFIKKYNQTLLQLILLSAIASFFTFTNGWLGLKSTLLGGSSWIIPNLYFRQKFQKIKTTFNTQKMLKWFLVNEAVKLLLSFGMIIAILLVCLIDRKNFLVGYMAMILASFIVPFWREVENER